jgi:hypothetical protein
VISINTGADRRMIPRFARALGCGAMGIVVPRVHLAEQARRDSDDATRPKASGWDARHHDEFRVG